MITWDLCTFTWITVSAIATLLMAAVTFAVFIRPWFRRPKFSIEYYTGGKFCHPAESRSFLDLKTKLPTYWIRLGIKNTGESVARRCLGKLVKVLDEHGKEKQEYDTMPLHWVITSWKEVPFRTIDLNRDENEYLNVLATQSDNKEVYFTGDQFPLAKWAKDEPRAIPKSLPRGKYILVITVYGDDVKPETKYLSLIWQADDMKHVSVKLHDDLQKAKYWFKKRELASAVGQPQVDASEPEAMDWLSWKAIVSQAAVYFIFILILVLTGEVSLRIYAGITLLWIIGLSMSAWKSRLSGKIGEVREVVVKFIQRFNPPYYYMAWAVVYWAGIVTILQDMLSADIPTSLRHVIDVILFLIFVLVSYSQIHFYWRRGGRESRVM